MRDNVVTFEEKVKGALAEVMGHAVAGDSVSGYHMYCQDPKHALAILKTHNIVPMNQHVIDAVLDKKT